MADVGKLAVTVSASSKGLDGDRKKAADVFGVGAGALEKVAAEKGKSAANRWTAGFSKVGKFSEKMFVNPAKAANGGDHKQLAGAMEMESSQADSAIVQFEQQGKGDVQEEIKNILEAQQRLMEEQNRIGADILRARGQKLEVVGI